MESIKDALQNKEKYKKDLLNRSKYVSKEYQDYGYRLALKLDQKNNVSLYIRLAKEKPRAWLEQALSFAVDYPNAKNKARLFMWKLKQLELEYYEKNPEKDSVVPEKNDSKKAKEKDSKKSNVVTEQKD